MFFRVIAFLFLGCVVFIEATKSRCYDHIGCFSMGEPWYSPDRPVPAPDPPEILKFSASFYSRPSINKEYYMQTWPYLSIYNAPFDSQKMTFFITHGYQTTGKDNWLGDMKSAILNKTDANVIIGDWGRGAKGVSFFVAIANIRMAGRQFSNLLQFMIDHYGLNPNRLHVIGHSLGAHVAGMIGKSIPGVFQITGLDPGQPLFSGFADEVRLTKEDATFVMVIHADARPYIPDLGFGQMNELGDVDFYMNSGHGQPGCSFPKVVAVPKITKLADFLTVPNMVFAQTVLCPHGLSHVFFTEAIKNDKCIFWGHNATMANFERGISNALTEGFFSKYLGISQPCTLNSCSPMSLDAYFWPARGAFIVTTRGSAPYCIYESSLSSEDEILDVIYGIEKVGIKIGQGSRGTKGKA